MNFKRKLHLYRSIHSILKVLPKDANGLCSILNIRRSVSVSGKIPIKIHLFIQIITVIEDETGQEVQNRHKDEKDQRTNGASTPLPKDENTLSAGHSN